MLMFSPSIKPAALSPSMKAASAPGSAPLRRAAQSTDHFSGLFRACCVGPRDSATEKGDEIATPHWRSPRLVPTCSRRSKRNVISTSMGPSVQNFTEREGGAYLFCRIYTRHVGPVAQLLMSAPGTLWPSQPGSRKPGRPPAPARLGQNLTQGRHRCIAASAGHSITSSARTSSDGGIVRPRVFAVLRLITSSNFVFCWMGRSAGLAPLRIFPT
jgi:hypothetical protein